MAYRALDFLVTRGFVHRVERLSAYVACAATADCHATAFLVCTDCRRVTEIPIDLASTGLDERACDAGFATRHVSVEVEGRCASCLTLGVE